MTFLKSRKPVQCFKIVPLSINVIAQQANGAVPEYALQYKKQSTPFHKNFSVEKPETFQLVIKTRKSAIRLFILEKKVFSSKEFISKKYKMRLKIQELMQKNIDSSEWKLLSVTLKDGSKLELKSMLVNHDVSETHSCLSDDDLSTIIMDDPKETLDELFLNIEEKDLEIKHLESKVKELEKFIEQQICDKEGQLRKLREENDSLKNQIEIFQHNETQLRDKINEAQTEIEALIIAKNSGGNGPAETKGQQSSNQKKIEYTNPVWMQKSLELFNHLSFIEQEVATLKKLMDFEKMQLGEKQHELVQKLRYYQHREEKNQKERQQLIGFVTGKKSNPNIASEAQAQSSIESLKSLLQAEKNCVNKLDIVIQFLSEYLGDKIDEEAHDRLLSDIYNPIMDKFISQLVAVLQEVFSSGLTGPWRITRKNSIWDCISQLYSNMLFKHNNRSVILSEDELNLYYSIKKVKKNEGKNANNWENLFRSWICIALNKQCLYAWLCILLRDEELVKLFYDQKNSILFKSDTRTKIDTNLHSLGAIPFALSEF